MEPLLVLDVSSLLILQKCVQPHDFNNLLDDLTVHVEKQQSGFPRKVVDELKILARDEPITRWCIGLGRRTLSAFTPPYFFTCAVMDVVASMGFDEGLEDPYGTESSMIYVAAIALKWQSEGKDVAIVSEDIGSMPLRPSMEQLSSRIRCPMICTREALSNHLDMSYEWT